MVSFVTRLESYSTVFILSLAIVAGMPTRTDLIKPFLILGVTAPLEICTPKQVSEELPRIFDIDAFLQRFSFLLLCGR